MARDYLVELLRAYWFAPPVALWRAIELRAASEPCHRSGRPILDLGCGDGLIGQILFETRERVDVGLDPWADQVRQTAASGVYRYVIRATGEMVPCRSGIFETVFSNSVLEHIVDPSPVLREVGRILRPEGRFIFTVPSDAFRRMLDGYARRMAGGDAGGATAYATRIDERLGHHHYYAPEQWRELLSAAGLSLLRAEYYMPEPAERLWDRMNTHFGVGQRRSAWKLLASPRLRQLGYQRLLRWLVVRWFGRQWRRYYEMDVEADGKGGGLLLIAER